MPISKLSVRRSTLNAWATTPELLWTSHYTMDALSSTGLRNTAIAMGILWERFKKLLAQFEIIGDEMGEEIETFCEELMQGEFLSEMPPLGKYWPSTWDEPGHFEYQDDKLKAALEECRDALLLAIYEGHEE